MSKSLVVCGSIDHAAFARDAVADFEDLQAHNPKEKTQAQQDAKDLHVAEV